MAQSVWHPAPYLPPDLLQQLPLPCVLLDKTLVTKDEQLTPLGVGVYWAIVSFIFCTLVYKLSRYYTPLYFPGYRDMSVHDQRDWDTRLGNILYSAYIVYFAIKLVAVDTYFWIPGRDPIWKRTSVDSYAVLGVSLGFFAQEMVVTVKYWMGGSAMVLHHVGSLISVTCALWTGDGHCLTLWMLSTECTTPFIAFRFLLDKAGLKTHPLYVINGLTIVASWSVARIATFPPFFVTVWRNRDTIKLMSPLSIFLVMVFPAVLALLNVWWYTKIVKGAIKVLTPKKKPPAKKE
ncbi:hypothetical protein HYH03_018845 [Edaphochlamys debaryana]|uniref:TLC domain-containing protein n=1 Tax=Edaphochlamys debaryana TaxID=47281 RepID=A0A836BNY3_9CHLO|nr:hypothetical protein HYH03_018845 [Edaphochlamys debaryana]|eukprot:KAG2482199.1 hypothetical protein HYH03_018845 [Edaphochlamys debaryana]